MSDLDWSGEELALPDARREALVAWMAKRLKSEAGGGIEIKKTLGKRSISFKGGYNGAMKWKNLGLGMGLTWATSAAVVAASQGEARLGFMVSVGLFGFYSTVGPALEGCKGAWVNARSVGEGRFTAFGKACQRAALGFKIKSVPSPWVAGVVAMAPLVFGMSRGLDAIKARAPGGSLEGMWRVGVNQVTSAALWLIERQERFDGWRMAGAVEAARLEGASQVGESIYAEVAKGWMRQRYFMTELNADENQKLADLLEMGLPPAEKALRESFKSLLSAGPHNVSAMLGQMSRMDAAGLGPWFKPEPGMPSLLDLGRSFGKWREELEGVSETLDRKLSEWGARVEARELGAAVGELTRADGAPVAQKTAANKRPRL